MRVFVECAYHKPGPHGEKGTFRRGIWQPEEQVPAWAARTGPTGLYTTIWRYERPDPRSKLVADFYADFDGEWEQVRQNALDVIRVLHRLYQYPIEQVRLYFSGAKGIHLQLPADAIGTNEPRRDWPEKYRYAAERLRFYAPTMDLKVYEGRRLWRLPGSRHEKTGLYKIPITYQELRDLSLHQIQELARSPRSLSYPPLRVAELGPAFWAPRKQTRHMVRPKRPSLDFLPPCVRDLQDRQTPAGERHNTLVVLASYCVARGYDLDEAMGYLRRWNRHRCVPPLPDTELTYQVQDVYARGGYTFGCERLAALGECLPIRCPLGIHRNPQTGKGPGLAGPPRRSFLLGYGLLGRPHDPGEPPQRPGPRGQVEVPAAVRATNRVAQHR